MFGPNTLFRACLAVGALLTFSAAAAGGAEQASNTGKRKDLFLSEKEQSFIRPGLNFEILGAEINGDVLAYRFRITDPRGLPLDLEGVFTPGVVSVRSVAAVIPQGEELYHAYTARTATSASTGQSAEQATFDSGGSFRSMGDGVYEYTFGTRLPQGFDQAATHTVAAWARRNLSEFDLGTYADSDTFDWVPNGSPVTVRREVVTDASCNACHGELSAHDNRTGVALCITCHTPQSADPDTGNSVDMTEFIHKLHRGADLPSVQAGEPYRIIGFGGSVFDFSAVEFPADVRNCRVCHVEDLSSVAAATAALTTASTSPSSGRGVKSATAAPTQQVLTANQHLLNPSRRACGSCHDDVNFATGQNHAGLPQISDNQCTRCHAPQGELEFDLSILGAHTVERASRELAGTHFEILGVTGAGPGERPTVRFSITNDAGDPVAPSSMGRLALVMAGQGADFSRFVSENAMGAEGAGGAFTYTFENPLPADAAGTWAVGIEGYQNGVILPGTEQERQVRDAGDNKVFSFSVTGGSPEPRRQVVSQQKCDACHFDLDLHGSNRNDVQMCVLCHNPATTDVARRPADAGAPESVNFKDMIHAIHTGEEFSREFTVFGFGGSPNNYNEVRFPNDRRNCDSCHIAGTELLPLRTDLLPTDSPRALINPTPPATAACLSCHSVTSAAAHADLNISPRFGESCDVCHGDGAEFSVSRVHAR